MPTQSLQNQIPFELLYNKNPDYQFLRVFGSAIYPLLRPYNKNKFSYRTSQCVFLGYSPHYLGYRCLNKDTGRIYFARHVKFDEHTFPFAQQPLSNANTHSPSSTPCL